MTWLAGVLVRWFGATPPPQPRPRVVPRPKAPPKVPGAYLSLYTYLNDRYASNVVLTFAQIEALLGFALPASARSESMWWTGASVSGHDHADAWTAAQRTALPNLRAMTVAFERAA